MIKKCILISCLITLCQTLMFQESLQAQSIPTPKSYFGFELGADGKLASWKSIVGYYRKLDSASDRILVKELGQSTLGNPFILIIITAPGVPLVFQYRTTIRSWADRSILRVLESTPTGSVVMSRYIIFSRLKNCSPGRLAWLSPTKAVPTA